MKIFKLASERKEYSINEKFFHIKNIRKFLLSNEIAIEICKEFGYDKDILLYAVRDKSDACFGTYKKDNPFFTK